MDPFIRQSVENSRRFEADQQRRQAAEMRRVEEQLGWYGPPPADDFQRSVDDALDYQRLKDHAARWKATGQEPSFQEQMDIALDLQRLGL
ncbi:MAG: hypothetical protein HY319_10360 [Armatimonadetes bacterium]|nr:hypothetical protein [Armatimonadota bacterium]